MKSNVSVSKFYSNFKYGCCILFDIFRNQLMDNFNCFVYLFLYVVSGEEFSDPPFSHERIHDISVKDISVRDTLVMDISVTGHFGNRTFR